ncbi:galactose mutarotase [soil metagenome]
MLTLRSSSGIVASFTPRGARLASLLFDGVEMLTGLEADHAGMVCGRFANRIANAAFELDGRIVHLVANQGRNILHGGPRGFDKVEWDASQNDGGVTFTMTSPDGDQGFPGALDAKARYTLKGDTLTLSLKAQCAAPTVVNLTNHAYWNLAGGGDARSHILEIAADHYLPVDDTLIPTGEIADVTGTDFDFRKPRIIATEKDHNFCLSGKRGTLRRAAVLRDPQSGRSLGLSTSEAGLQLYTSQHFKPPLTQYGGIALEPQTWPDAPNRAAFPSAVLRPGETYRHMITWKFSV